MNIVIVGGGQIGSYIGLLLYKKHHVRIIENREKALHALKKSGISHNCIIVGDGTSLSILEQAEIRNADALVCATGLDEVNLMVAMLAKFEYNVKKVIARVNNPKNSWMFHSGNGVDAAINQADIIGHMIADEMNYQSIMTLIKLSKGEYSIVRIHVDTTSMAVGKTLAQIHLPKSALIIAMFEENTIEIPHGDSVIKAGVDLLAFANETSIAKLNRIFGYKM